MTRTPRAHAILALALLAGTTLPAHPARAAKSVYSCVLTGKQEVPANSTTGSGGGRFVIDTDANTVDYWISYAGLSSAETAAHIHGQATPVPSNPGTNGSVLLPLPPGN